MSVINKMLRDLDQRQVPDDNGSVKPGATPLRSGTASVPDVLIPTNTSRSNTLMPLAKVSMVAMLVAVFAGAGWWWLHKAAPNVLSAELAQTVPVPVPASALVPVTTPMNNAAVAPPSQVVAAPPSAALVPPAVPMAASSAAAKPAAASSAPGFVQPTAKAPLIATSAAVDVTSAPVRAPLPAPAASATVAAVPDAASTGQRQQQAAREALAQAQTLWNAGGHDNAIDLLQQAVATAERSAQSTPGAPATQALASLARELARMQVAQGRPGATVDMLTRLEPLLSGEPDMWAVRANAAQRAGRHQESVNAYTTALQARPNEQRWMLGAAVSSAALGQMANASALAEKAAAVGPVPKDVQAYLRQLGVAFKD